MTTTTTAEQIRTIEDLIRAHEYAGGFFFRSDSKRFFRSRIGGVIYKGPGGIYFTTSEQFEDSRGNRAPRLYTVRKFNPDNPRNITEVGGFQAHRRLESAKAAAIRAAVWGADK